jgi:hypothetical protein
MCVLSAKERQGSRAVAFECFAGVSGLGTLVFVGFILLCFLFFFFFLGFWLVILEYTSCVRRGALCFLIKLLLLIKKKESNLVWR